MRPQIPDPKHDWTIPLPGGPASGLRASLKSRFYPKIRSTGRGMCGQLRREGHRVARCTIERLMRARACAGSGLEGDDAVRSRRRAAGRPRVATSRPRAPISSAFEGSMTDTNYYARVVPRNAKGAASSAEWKFKTRSLRVPSLWTSGRKSIDKYFPSHRGVSCPAPSSAARGSMCYRCSAR